MASKIKFRNSLINMEQVVYIIFENKKNKLMVTAEEYEDGVIKDHIFKNVSAIEARSFKAQLPKDYVNKFVWNR